MAQLDSASDSDSDGWRFESVWVRHLRPLRFAKVFFFAYQTDSVPIADAIDTSCNNRYYVRLCSPQIRLGVPLKNRYLDSGFFYHFAMHSNCTHILKNVLPDR